MDLNVNICNTVKVSIFKILWFCKMHDNLISWHQQYNPTLLQKVVFLQVVIFAFLNPFTKFVEIKPLKNFTFTSIKSALGYINWAIPEIRGNPTPQKKTNIFSVKNLGIPGSNFDLKKMGILKIVLKNGNS